MVTVWKITKNAAKQTFNAILLILRTWSRALFKMTISQQRTTLVPLCCLGFRSRGESRTGCPTCCLPGSIPWLSIHSFVWVFGVHSLFHSLRQTLMVFLRSFYSSLFLGTHPFEVGHHHLLGFQQQNMSSGDACDFEEHNLMVTALFSGLSCPHHSKCQSRFEKVAS